MHPPLATKRPVARVLHGDETIDPYEWLRDASNPDVLAYLQAENAYTAAAMADLQPLREHVYAEIKARVLEDDLSAPARRGPWWYGRRTETDHQYPIFLRWHGAPVGPAEVILDQNQVAQGRDFCALGQFSVSPNHELLAYGVDDTGRESFELRFRHLATGEDLEDRVQATYYGGAWSADGSRFFYTTFDHAHRAYRVWRHRVGSSQDDDGLVYQEDDERFHIDLLHNSRDRSQILITSRSSTTSEVLYIRTSRPDSAPVAVTPRQPGVRYLAEPQHGNWLMATDYEAPNGRLLSFPAANPADVTELIPHDPTVKVSRVLPFERHLVVVGRRQGNPSFTIVAADGSQYDLTFPESAYRLEVGDNLEYAISTFRFTYSSFLTPRRVVEVDLDTGDQAIVKQTVVPNFDPSPYEQSRIWVSGDDASGQVSIPVTLLKRRDAPLPAPTLLYGYGAYESVLDPDFEPGLFSLLDRGMVYAVAHVRGGGEMGRLWHAGGRMEQKVNTFTDFIACAERLLDSGLVAPGALAARGLSAGGLLMGVITTMRPDLWAAIVAEVPFVDVINSMLDPDLPLTVGEWEEWGNPVEVDQYRWLIDYSPYDRTVPAQYPAILATAGLNDTRVAFWEPAKWIARLRTVNQGSRPIALKTDLGVGHSGRSGRYDAWQEEAFILAFVLDQVGAAGLR